MAVPYTFGAATSAIPLSQLDSNFATTITLGNTAIQLGNTVTTLNNMTLANVTVQSGNVTIGQANAVVYTNSSNVATANASVLAFDGSNLGLGVAPSAWVSRGFIDFIGNGFIGDSTSISSNTLLIGHNAYYSNTGWKYKSTFGAGYYQMQGTAHYWNAASSGTAGNPITFTQILAVDKGSSLALEGATTQTGTGISFPATQSASSNANTLDDYEEGTFTPTFLINGVDQSGNGAGSYTKIGRCVTFTITFYNDTWTRSGSGTVQIGGLPFSGVNISGGAGGGSYCGYKFILPNDSWLNVPTTTTGTIYGGAGPISSSSLNAGTFLFEQLYGVYFTS